MKTTTRRAILICGAPRSGTTWIGDVCQSAPATRYAFEPDNAKSSLLAWGRGELRHRFEALDPSTDDRPGEAFWRRIFAWDALDERLAPLFQSWASAHAVRRERLVAEACGLVHFDSRMRTVDASRSARRVGLAYRMLEGVGAWSMRRRGASADCERLIVKSVHALFQLDWLAARFDPQVVLVSRNPYALYASYRRLAMPDGVRNIVSQPRVQAALDAERPGWRRFEAEVANPLAVQTGLLCWWTERLRRAHPGWIHVAHDRLCADPEAQFRSLFGRLALAYPGPAEARLTASMRPGSGFTPNRIPQDQPTKWRRELDASEVAALDATCAFFRLDSNGPEVH